MSRPHWPHGTQAGRLQILLRGVVLSDVVVHRGVCSLIDVHEDEFHPIRNSEDLLMFGEHHHLVNDPDDQSPQLIEPLPEGPPSPVSPANIPRLLRWGAFLRLNIRTNAFLVERFLGMVTSWGEGLPGLPEALLFGLEN